MILLKNVKSVFVFACRLRRAFNCPQLTKAAPRNKAFIPTLLSEHFLQLLFATFCNLQIDRHSPKDEVA
jgi:hypothetical protein